MSLYEFMMLLRFLYKKTELAYPSRLYSQALIDMIDDRKYHRVGWQENIDKVNRYLKEYGLTVSYSEPVTLCLNEYMKEKPGYLVITDDSHKSCLFELETLGD